ncbi:LuxR C-terminal-related transcriptional regulator [Thermodesulfobacteriota bacterium]
MKGSILYTKLQRPPEAPDIVPRDRLLDRLNAGLHRPLTLISAAAGYGKSTLASRWVAGCDYPYAWVSLEESDSELQMFLSYVLAAIQTLFPRTDFRTEAILETSQMPPAADLARHLLNDLHQIPEPFNLVLDDYHRIQRGSPVNDLLDEFLAYPPQGMHLVLLTRQDPSLPIATMRGRGLVTEIRASDLRFTPDEAAAFLGRMLNVVVDETTAALLEIKTEGWATGLRLAGLYLQGQKELKRSLQQLSGNSRHIAEYLFAEVLSRQHPEKVSYLLETSVLNRFCAPLCHQMHLIGSHGHDEKSEVGPEQFIQWLADNNLFVIALDNEGHWFRYHHLFHDFLKGELYKQWTKDRIASLHRGASRWFNENGLIEEAIDHLLAVGDTSATMQLILDHRHALMNHSQYFRLHRLLARLPENAVAEEPLLASTRAFICIDLGNDVDAYVFTQKAIEMLAEISPESEAYSLLKGEVLMLQGLVSLLTGVAETARTQAEKAFDYIPENALMIRSLGIGIIAICHQMKGNRQQAVAVIKEALSDPTWQANLRARLHFYLTIILYIDADLSGAMTAALECLRTIRNLSFVHTRTFADYILGAAQYLQNQTEAAKSSLLKVVDDRQAANPSYVAHAGFILAYIYLEQENEAAADRLLDQIGAHCRENNHITVLSIIQAFEAEFALRRGDTQKAWHIAQHADFGVREPMWFLYIPQLTPIKCLLDRGTHDNLQEAHNRLIQLEERMRRINRESVRIEILALLALVCHKQRDETAALQNLQTALDLAEPGNWIRTFVDLGMEMKDLLDCLIQQQTGQTYAQHVLKACQAEHSKKASLELDATTKAQISEPSPNTVLTRREIEILPLLAEGLSNKEIAARLHVAPLTVKTHLQNIYKKLNAKNRIETLKISREVGIIIDN